MIIGISGKKGSGKSTVASMLSKELGWPVTAFANKLKEITCALSGCTMEQLEDYDFKENKLIPNYLWNYCNCDKAPTYRNFLQHFGGDIMRSFYPNVWVEATLLNAPNDLIVSDCRYINEAQEINNRNGIVVRVLNGVTSTVDLHSSETQMENIKPDVILWNTGSLDELRVKVAQLAEDVVNFTVKAEY
jgi:hypothetical protein